MSTWHKTNSFSTIIHKQNRPALLQEVLIKERIFVSKATFYLGWRLYEDHDHPQFEQPSRRTSQNRRYLLLRWGRGGGGGYAFFDPCMFIHAWATNNCCINAANCFDIHPTDLRGKSKIRGSRIKEDTSPLLGIIIFVIWLILLTQTIKFGLFA